MRTNFLKSIERWGIDALKRETIKSVPATI